MLTYSIGSTATSASGRRFSRVTPRGTPGASRRGSALA